MNALVKIEEFIDLSKSFPLIDVRSPGEFKRGHVPGAYNIPLFDNDERAKVGTAYKQTGRQEAIKIGLELVGPKLASFVQQTESAVKNSKAPNGQPTVLVHCWRGGMRSANFAHLLNVYGFKTYTLVKGYKAYRNFILKSFDRPAHLIILGGETGSGKTEILQKIRETGEQVLDLESLAHHKGSAFGALGETPQPTQEQFENDLANEMNRLDLSKRIWVEDESRSIGTCQLPEPLWKKMKEAPILSVQIPKEQRIRRLLHDYGRFSKEELAACIGKITKRLGPQHAKHALQELEKGNLETTTDILLAYYDKAYHYSHEQRGFKDVFPIECNVDNAALNANTAIQFANEKLKKEYA